MILNEQFLGDHDAPQSVVERIASLERAYSTIFDMLLERDWMVGAAAWSQLTKQTRHAFWWHRIRWTGFGIILGALVVRLIG